MRDKREEDRLWLARPAVSYSAIVVVVVVLTVRSSDTPCPHLQKEMKDSKSLFFAKVSFLLDVSSIYLRFWL